MEVNLNGIKNVNPSQDKQMDIIEDDHKMFEEKSVLRNKLEHVKKSEIDRREKEKEEKEEEKEEEENLKDYTIVEFKDSIEVSKIPFPTQIINEKQDIPLCARQFSDLTDPLYIKCNCLDKIKEWSNLNTDDLCVNQILCGLTNQLFEVSIKKEKRNKKSIVRNKVFFRIYGKDIKMLYNSAFELEVFKTMSKYHIGPLLLNTFDGGRIEEWLDGDPLSVEDLNNPAVLACLANLIGKYHTLCHKNPLPSSWDKTPCVYRRMEKWINEVIKIGNYESSNKDSTTVNTTTNNNTIINNNKDSNNNNNKDNIDINKYINEANRYLKFLKKYTKNSKNPANNVVFCHNDLQENNIISTENCLRLIDFEYSDYNYLAFDIANLFVEATIDYRYNTHPFFLVNKDKYICYELRNLFASIYLSVYLNNSTLPSNEALIKPFLDAVEVHALSSHLVWGFWGIIRAHQMKSYNDFDFTFYAEERFRMYDRQKELLVKTNVIEDF